VYSKTDEEFQDSMNNINQLENNQKFKDCLHENLKRSNQWSMLYRNSNSLITRNNQTNNYSEASIRILKEIVLERTKAYNIVALIEFIAIIWDKYFINRLLDFAYNRRSKSHFEMQLTRMSTVNICTVVKIDDYVYKVPSTKDSKKMYEVNTIVGWCSCYSGQQGGFCKHQAFLKKHFPNLKEFPNCPVVNCDVCYNLALLALGDECPPKPFFEVIHTIKQNLFND